MCVMLDVFSQSNQKLVGGRCEGCEAVFEHDNSNFNHIDTLPDFDAAKIKL